MKLSEAMLLGHSLKNTNGTVFLCWPSDISRPCGCAIGGAVLAVRSDITQDEIQGASMTNGWSLTRDVWPWLEDAIPENSVDEFIEISKYPWEVFKKSYSDAISEMFYRVEEGQVPIEALVDWVRKYEPEEQGGEELPVETEEVAYAAV